MSKHVVECGSCGASYETVAPRSAIELVRRCDKCGGRLRLADEAAEHERQAQPERDRARDDAKR